MSDSQQQPVAIAGEDFSDHEGLLEVIKYALGEAIEMSSVPDAAKYKATMTYMPAVTAVIQEVQCQHIKSLVIFPRTLL